jgi:epoxide hydrolase-like predicted phosphatase
MLVINTIFFDFGGVIIKTPDYRWVKRRKNILGLNNHPEILDLLDNPHESALMKEICLGKIPEDHLWTIMAEKWRVKPNVIKFFRRQMASKRHLNQPVMRFMAEAKENHQTAILSNAGDQSRRLMEDVYKLHHYVDEIIISAEEGVIKPDPRIYEIAMERMHAEPETSLLLDDHLPNILAAQAFGMHAVQFINALQAIQMVRDHLNGRY